MFEIFAANPFLTAVLVSSLLGIVVAFWLAASVLGRPQGEAEMRNISQAIQTGANAYLKRQFTTIAPIVLILTAFLYFTSPNPMLAAGRAGAFLMGAFFSGLIGTIGMNIATRANVRVTEAAKSSFGEAMGLAFRAGATTGMLTVGLGLLGATLIYWIYGANATEVLVGFGFGGSLLALFMRVGGGIYTKEIPEDDPRNAAVIADQVGDNVGDCAGMAADLFESYEVTLVAALILGGVTFGLPGVLFPLAVRALGIGTSLLGILTVNAKGKTEIREGMNAIIRSFAISAVVSIIGFFVLAGSIAGDLRLAVATTIGIVLSVAIFLLTEYATGDHKPVKDIAKQSQTGPATVILSGFVSGFSSTVWAILAIGVTILASFLLFPDPLMAAYGVALAGMGMLTTTGLIVSMDSFGPIADNAQGIAELSGIKGKALSILPKLDSIGNTTKATTKGFAIASAVVAAVSLFESYLSDTGLAGINIAYPAVFVGFLIGGAIPFLFSSLTIKAVSDSAYAVIKEVRRQFKEMPGIMKGTQKPDYARVVDLTTKSALSALAAPALIAIIVPLLVGFLLKAEALGGFLAGTILTGQLLAVLMANTGGAWDNAKKMIEDGLYGGKGSEAHKATVVGDTVGDPLKDTSGPAINPLLKVMNLVALLAVPMMVATQTLTLTHWILIAAGSLILIYSLFSSLK
ncbi:MAG: K(+)-insensitive pyrophosphate-energized proton pump [Candidatus Woesebacteria bacterium GW2011_GWC2_45_9]|uniref:K(+)-insensitive pyrophosphate-energized proton pump n=1 Tax=Candidatus Woesebacteria bacterium GW2011_GWC2_45_9 TaxID=1618589 RepID=A0A0G1N7V0_9BACT|nr:MAG: K(+)-insensitive pyrophosphate-energized proton pump [Candidatus Woesebacteria bacterium GW2011_GWC2_45_9]